MVAIRKGRKSKPAPGKRDGRPPVQDAALDAALADVLAGSPISEAAEKHGLTEGRTRTLRRRVEVAQKGAGAAPMIAPASSPLPPSVASPAVAHASAPATTVLPQGGAVSGRPDLLVLVRRILGKRDPAALAVLDAGLVVATRGEQELAAWLDLPLERRDPLDPLDAAVAALSAASAYVESLPPTSPRAATILGAAANLAKTVEAIGRGRVPIAPPDEVNERVRGAMATCVEHLLRPVREAAAKLARDRAALFDGLVEDVAPRHLAEIGRRVDAMLGASA